MSERREMACQRGCDREREFVAGLFGRARNEASLPAAEVGARLSRPG